MEYNTIVEKNPWLPILAVATEQVNLVLKWKKMCVGPMGSGSSLYRAAAIRTIVYVYLSLV